MRWTTIIFCVLSAVLWAPLAVAEDTAPKVNFGYAFATPHRMTAARPESSDKTLLDVLPDSLRLGWTYETLVHYPLAAFATPRADWGVKLTPQMDGKPFAGSTWTRAEGYLPILENTYTSPEGSMGLEVAGGVTGTMVRITLANTGSEKHAFSLPGLSQRGFFGYNPGYVDPDRDHDCLLAGWGDRADRVIVLGIGADAFLIQGAVTLCPTWELGPGEKRTAWIIQPYSSYTADLPGLRAQDWQREFDQAKEEWRTLLSRAARIHIPDTGVTNGFYACLSDLFIMREPVADGYIAGTPGTDGYRAPNAGEPLIAGIAFDQLGLHAEAEYGARMCYEQQGDDGDWNDPKGWGHLMWATSGFKSWSAIEHYRLTGDRAFLEKVYPHLRANTRWQETQRARTRVMKDGTRPVTYGLMPRGMGDCGITDDGDLYGVFLPHNIWSVYADRVAAEAAEILGQTAEAKELRGIFDTAWADLQQALDRGAIAENGYRWIPGVAGKTCGSRWGALNALFPCALLPADNELISGTLRQVRAHMSEGGLPLNTGWMENGLWVAIALDNVAETHLLREEGDAAADLLYATLNHGTPLYTWCEERAPEPGAEKTTGDRQHLWTPVAVVREVRDSLLMEEGATLHLARGTHRAWLGSGQPVGITAAATHFGDVAFDMTYDAAAKRVQGKVVFPKSGGTEKLETAVLHLRLPAGLHASGVNAESKAALLSDGTGLRWTAPKGEYAFTADVK